MSTVINESQFYMWRTLFAIVHVDNVVANQEVTFMAEVLEDIPFSVDQIDVLRGDIVTAQDPAAMFALVTDPLDKARFFAFARELVWVDGRYVAEEQEKMIELEKAHLRDVDIDDLIGKVELEFEDDVDQQITLKASSPHNTLKALIHAVRDDFLKEASSLSK